MGGSVALGRLLEPALRRDPSGPLLTWYDEPSGERVELSATTLDNWVAKTAHLLDDLLAGAPGVVGLRLPAHWQALVVALAAWRTGSTLALGDDANPTCDLLVVGPTELDLAAAAPEGLAVSLRPLNGRLPEPPPPGVADYAAEVLGHADSYPASPGPGGAATPLPGLSPGDRVLLAIPRDGVGTLIESAAATYAAGASLVVCLDADPDTLDRRMAAERATHRLP